MTTSSDYTIGVEEEFAVLDAATGELRPGALGVVRQARHALGEEIQPELNLSQVETGTPVCRTLDDVREEVCRLRRAVMQAAEAAGCVVAATGAHPRARWQEQGINPTKPRYRYLEEEFALTAREQLVNGCHVHIGIADPDLAVAVLDRSRLWLGPLLALSANSPFWTGVDSGYASYRSQVWAQWPLSGTPEPLGSRAGYERLVDELVRAGALPDSSFIYWDVRPSSRYPTLEFRIADACLTVDETVMVAGLVRALARTAAVEAEHGATAPSVRRELIEVAKWKAARYGLEGELIDVELGRSVPAAHAVRRLLETLRPALEEFGEWEAVRDLVDGTLARGNGAQRQRAAFARRGELDDVVELIVAETEAGVRVRD